ncbi:unnamed protein product [Prunus armeniaca]|uniref:Uncharacterized protein n=1 Tax=Prunus armeniaca TaxID=36596 RepID=A0A6J5Y7N6_PRUAR|nr:unnamed protein product [Prunus armeniaca]
MGCLECKYLGVLEKWIQRLQFSCLRDVNATSVTWMRLSRVLRASGTWEDEAAEEDLFAAMPQRQFLLIPVPELGELDFLISVYGTNGFSSDEALKALGRCKLKACEPDKFCWERFICMCSTVRQRGDLVMQGYLGGMMRGTVSVGSYDFRKIKRGLFFCNHIMPSNPMAHGLGAMLGSCRIYMDTGDD